MRRLACGLILACLAAGCQTVQQDTDQRHVELDGQSNFRDLGGYETEDGRVVAMGKVYRSGRLSSLSDEDVARLESLDIDVVVNFLTPEEIEAEGQDRLPAGVDERPEPIDVEGDLALVILEARRTGDFSQVPVEINPGIHEMLPDEARGQYASLLREVADADRDVVAFHCSHGVHRTGSAAAILLWTLGVPWETIREDYLLSNEYRRDEIDRRIEQLRQLAAQNQGIEPAQVDVSNIRAFYELEGSYIDATRDQILSEYGSIDSYLTDGLGLAPAEIEAIRAKMLEDR